MSSFEVYNYRNVSRMPSAMRTRLESHDLLELYFDGYADLGPRNPSSLARHWRISKLILDNELPLPPSGFIDYVCNLTSGKSKQDFRMTMDGKPGMGKSTSCMYNAARYAIEMADRFNKDCHDYFNMDYCVMLQDTGGVTDLLAKAPKFAAVIIDDAGVAVGSREFSTLSNRNLTKIYQTCRTKRWFTQINVPVVTQIDKQIRELVSAKSRVHRSYHNDGFNIIKINTIEISTVNKTAEYKHRIFVRGKQVDYWTTYSPDILPGYAHYMEHYDKLREDAADDLISTTNASEQDRKKGVSKRDKKYQEELTAHGQTVLQMINEGESYAKITKKTGLSPYKADRIFRDMSGDK
jgi:uncharacterized protein YerC